MLYLTILKFQLRFHSQLSLSPITRHSWDLMVVQPTILVCLELPVFSPENLSPDSPSVLGKPEKLHLLRGESQAKRQDLLVCLSCLFMTLEQWKHITPLGPLPSPPPFLFTAFTLMLRDEDVRTHDSYWSLLPSSFVIFAYLQKSDLSQWPCDLGK